MPSEARRGIVRIAANYTRLITNVVLGLISVNILLRVTGNDGWALIATLGATTGIANLTEESVRRSMIRELAAALHSDDHGVFARVYNTALLVAIGKWNMAMTTAQNLHLRADQLITNFFFGLAFNLPFGLAMQLTSYVRMLTVGMTDGLDAATTRLAAKKGEHSVRDLVRHSTRLHAFVSVPTGIGLAILAEPVLDLWVGNSVQNRTVVIAQAALIMRIIILGVTLRALSDGWIRILYGAGHIRSYARHIVLWSIANPVLAVVLSKSLPDDVAHLGPAIAFSTITLIISAVIIPIVGARCLGLTPAALAAPAARPTLIAALLSPVLLAADHLIAAWTYALLAGACALYAALVTFGCVAFAMSSDERRRFASAILRRARPGSRRPPAP